MSTTVKSMLPYVGVLVLFFGAASTSGVALWRLDAQAETIKKQEEELEELEDVLNALDRAIITRQNSVDLRTQRIELEQKGQSEDLEEILLLLKRLSDTQ